MTFHLFRPGLVGDVFSELGKILGCSGDGVSRYGVAFRFIPEGALRQVAGPTFTSIVLMFFIQRDNFTLSRK